MNRRPFIGIASALMVCGVALAQTAPPPPRAGRAGMGQGMRQGPGGFMGGGLNQRIFANLNLTDAQKQQVQSIMQQANQSSQSLRDQIQKNRQDLNAAVKANNTSAIQSLSATAGTLQGQLLAIRETARAQVYALLTPEQKDKMDKLQQAARMLANPPGQRRQAGQL